jgi:Integrase core domain
MPRMNAIMERWIQSCRHELLDRMPVWNQAHLLRALYQYERHHNAHRPHRGIANARPPQPITDLATSPISTSADVTASAASSTNTNTPHDLHGRGFRGVFPILKTLGYAACSRVGACLCSYSIGVS